MNNNDLIINVVKLLSFKTTCIKQVIPEISFEDVASYFLSFQLRKKYFSNLNEAASLILNISENKIIEYLNIRATTDKTVRLDDFKDLFNV